MGELKGKLDTAIGKVKEKVGYATGNDQLQAKGAAQALKGKAESEIGKKANDVRKAVDEAVDKI